MIRALVLGLLFAGLALPAFTREFRAGDLVIEEPWARATPAGAGVGAGYMVIRNTGAAPDRLVGGDAAFAGRIEIHEMAMRDGIMRMRELADGLEIPPGAAVTLEPGGYHVMFMQLEERLVEGEIRTMTLVFDDAGAVEITLPVRGMAAGMHRD